MRNIKPKEISKEVARRFLVSRQGFLQKKRGKDGTLEAIRRLECIQIDPISVVHRNQHLVLHNRIVDYKPSYLEQLLYKDRLLFEYWCNEKSIIPIEDFPFFRYRMQNPPYFHSPFYERIKRKRTEFKEDVSFILAEIRKKGPLSSKELKETGEIKRRVATNILNLLWDFGELMVHHVEGNRRYYDNTEQILPSNIDKRVPSKEEYIQFMVEKYLKAYRRSIDLDPKLDRNERTMIINSIYLEKETFDTTTFAKEFANTFQRFLNFHEISQFRITFDFF